MGWLNMNGIWIGRNRGSVSWSSYWNARFTGIPIRHFNNPLGTDEVVGDDCWFRCIVKVGATYHLFEENTAAVWSITKRTSTNGLGFTAKSAPLLAAGGAGTFDVRGQADPTVIYDGVGDWKMWFDALGPVNWTVGYATSADGTTWVNHGKVIDVGAGAAWDNYSIHHPVCIKVNSIYYLFYSGAKTTDGNGVKHIGLATSTDGINWTKEPSNPVISCGASGTWDGDYIRPSAPVLIYGLWYMWYWGFDGTYHKMGLATSPDLITWTKVGKVLGEDAGDPDLSTITASQAVLYEGTDPRDRLVKLYYTLYPLKWLCFANVALPYSGTKISNFSISHSVRFGSDVKTATAASRGANYIHLFRVTVSATTTITHIKAFLYSDVDKAGASYKFKMAVYSNNVNTPQNLIVESEERDWTSILGGTYNTFALSTPTEFAAGDYWIGIWSNIAIHKIPFAAGGANNYGNVSAAYGAFPNPITATTTQGYDQVSLFLCNLRTNVYEVDLVAEPSKVYFNTVTGNKVASIAAVDSEYDWFWASGILYVYAEEHPDLRYQLSYE
jgi:predicted GH43/DUF377 family glycosyl hydrolase